MTEKTATKNMFNWINRARKPGYLIDPVAFFIALICGPLLFTLTTFWIFLIPLFALFFGGPVYLLISTPLLLLYLRYFKGDIGGLALLGLGANIALLAILYLISVLAPHIRNIDGYINVASFGLIFAPLWAASFGHLYLKLRKPFYACAHRY